LSLELGRVNKFLLLASLCAVAGCSRAPQQAPAEQGKAAGSQAAVDPHAVLGARWASMFADPAAVVAAANEFGYKAGTWTRSGSGFQSIGNEQALPKGLDRAIVRTGFRANGTTAGRVGAITFTFAVDQRGSRDTRQARNAVNIPRRIVAGFLSRFGVSPTDEIRGAVQTGRSATMVRDGGRIVVDSTPMAGGYRSIVTITPA
jgi:hypothetical protein